MTYGLYCARKGAQAASLLLLRGSSMHSQKATMVLLILASLSAPAVVNHGFVSKLGSTIKKESTVVCLGANTAKAHAVSNVKPVHHRGKRWDNPVWNI